jgi:hypothetical protein
MFCRQMFSLPAFIKCTKMCRRGVLYHMYLNQHHTLLWPVGQDYASFSQTHNGGAEVLVALLLTESYSLSLLHTHAHAHTCSLSLSLSLSLGLPQISCICTPMKIVQYLKFASLRSKVWWPFIITLSV